MTQFIITGVLLIIDAIALFGILIQLFAIPGSKKIDRVFNNESKSNPFKTIIIIILVMALLNVLAIVAVKII